MILSSNSGQESVFPQMSKYFFKVRNETTDTGLQAKMNMRSEYPMLNWYVI